MADRHPTVQTPAIDLHPGEAKTGVDLQLLSGGVEVTGTVSDIGGGPIARARVHVYPLTSYESSPPVETDESGAFRLWAWAGGIGIRAEADGYTDSTEYGLAPGSFTLALTVAGSLSGTVVGGTGLPAAGARVTISTDVELLGGYGSFELTDEQGRFRFERLNAGRYSVAATAEHGYGRSDATVLVELGRNSEGAIVKLYPAVRVEGRILVEGTPDTPCPKSWFTLSLGERATRDELWARGDADGFVRHDGVLPGSYTVNIDCPGHARTETSFKLEVGDRDVTGLIWKFTKAVSGATLRGHVRDSTGTPIAGAYVEANGAGWGRTTTRSDGAYEIKDLSQGDVSLRVTGPRGVGRREGWKVVVPASGIVEQDVVLDAGCSIEGSVADSAGRPVSGIKVMSDFNGHYPTVTSGRDGGFRFDNVPVGEVSLYLEEPGAPQQRSTVMVRASAASKVSFVVAARPGKIMGTVVDASGKPVGDAFVTAERELEVSTSTAARVLTASDGSFTLTPLVLGTYQLKAARTGAGEAIVEHVDSGANVRIQIKPTGSIAGVVKSSRGEVADVVVSIESARGLSRRERFYRTGGRYRFEDLPAGSYRITARVGDGEGQSAVELASGASMSGVDVVFSTATVEGRIVDVFTRQPVSGIKIRAWLKAGGLEHDATSGPDGRFALEDVANGLVWFGVDGDAYERLELTREVTGPTARLGDVAIVRTRYQNGRAGRLGLTFGNDSLRVIEIDPTGPAAKTQLAVGDIVTTIDGIELAGVERSAALSMLLVPVGTAIRLGLSRGTTIVVTTAPR